MNFKENAKFYIENQINLNDCPWETQIDWDLLSEEESKSLISSGYDKDYPYVWLSDIERLDLSHAVTSWERMRYSQDEAEYVMESLLKKANHYLVMLHNCRWNDAFGYAILDDVHETIARIYDATIVPKAVSKGGKCLICKESSHDVPMGARTSIIALTDTEYERLKNASFEEVEKFADECERRAA